MQNEKHSTMATKYNDIVTLRSKRLAYNIKEEAQDEWKTFIANEQFNEILRKMVSAVRNNDADNHRSMWIVGTYGTGKSHAGAVLKHLFCDPIEDIREYVEDEYKKSKYDVLRNSVLQVREQKRLFPVNLYGQHSIAHEEDLSLQLQREVKRALEKAGLNIVVKTDFDTLVKHIDEQPVIWENLIETNAELESIAPDLKKLKQLLTTGDTEALERVRNAQRQSRIDIRMEHHNIQQWIFEVEEKLKEGGVYDGLLIIWDEFTEVMTSSIGVRLLVQLQEITEAMTSDQHDSYFLFISHPSALYGLREEEREKTKGRYHYVHYNMEPVSAFKIMSKKFKIVDESAYTQRQSRFYVLHSDILDQYSSSSANAEETKENIRNLFPIHPATANLATYYAREAGSSSRSVFEFLGCDEVRAFLDSEDAFNNERTITADYLWDYVRPNFENDSTKFGAVTERYHSNIRTVENAGDDYLKVFKGILLLNALNNIANSETVVPSQENIDMLFAGTEINNLQEILDYFNDKSIIQRQPNGNYSILFTALPGEEIQKIKDELARTNYLYTDQVIKFGDTATADFGKYLSQVSRPIVFQFYSQQSNEFTLLNRIENQKKATQPYEIFLAVLVARNTKELTNLKDIALRASGDGRFQHVAFAVTEAVFGDKEYERFIEYQANATCAQRHGLATQQKTYAKNASEMIQTWVKAMKGSNVTFYMHGEQTSISGSKLSSSINNMVAPIIFEAGPESLDIIRAKNSNTYWKKASVKATVDAVLNYNTKSDIVSKCGGQARHVEFLLQDSVDENLEWKSDCDPKHPLKLVCDYVHEMLSGRHTYRNQSFNLGDKLFDLTKPPYGLYQTYAPMAMVAFAMRKYINQIYDTNGKQRSAQHLVDDVVEMFKAWESQKTSKNLNFMFESKEAGQLTKKLVKMFSLDKLKKGIDVSSLKNARWAITHEYAQQQGYPLWSLKYSTNPSNTEDMRKLIDNVLRIAIDPESMKNPSLIGEALAGYDQLKFDWGNLVLPVYGAFKEGFQNFMQSVEIVDVQNDEVDEAFNYLQQHLAGEVGLWTEVDVKDKLKDWRMSKRVLTPKVPGVSEPPSTAYNPQPGSSVTPSELHAQRQKAAMRLEALEDRQLRTLLNQLIENADGHIIANILKYV